MKSLVYAIAIAMTAIGSTIPTAVTAQNAIVSPGIERIPLGGFHSTTIYTPSPDGVTTIVKTQIGDLDRSYPTAPYNYYGGTIKYGTYIPYQQPIVIYRQQEPTYPRATLTRCVLQTRNDSNHTLVAVDRSTGKPCD